MMADDIPTFAVEVKNLGDRLNDLKSRIQSLDAKFRLNKKSIHCSIDQDDSWRKVAHFFEHVLSKWYKSNSEPVEWENMCREFQEALDNFAMGNDQDKVAERVRSYLRTLISHSWTYELTCAPAEIDMIEEALCKLQDQQAADGPPDAVSFVNKMRGHLTNLEMQADHADNMINVIRSRRFAPASPTGRPDHLRGLPKSRSHQLVSEAKSRNAAIEAADHLTRMRGPLASTTEVYLADTTADTNKLATKANGDTQVMVIGGPQEATQVASTADVEVEIFLVTTSKALNDEALAADNVACIFLEGTSQEANEANVATNGNL